MAANWFIRAPDILGNTLGSRPVVRQFKKNLRAIGQQLIADETVAQAEFTAEVQKEFKKRLAHAQGSPDIDKFDRGRKIEKVQRNFGGSGIEGLPA